MVDLFLESPVVVRPAVSRPSHDSRAFPYHAAPFRCRVGEPEISRPGSFRRRLIGCNGARRRIGDHHGTAQRYAPQPSAIAITEYLSGILLGGLLLNALLGW
jgi:hypothetical protein